MPAGALPRGGAPRDEAPRKLTIEEAELQPGEEGDEILVVVGVEHEGFFPDLFLMDARSRQAARKKGVYGRGAESRWPEEGAIETVEMGRSYVIVYHEDPHPDEKVADPENTPYYVLCSASTMRTVEAHVEGTPKASPWPCAHTHRGSWRGPAHQDRLVEGARDPQQGR